MTAARAPRAPRKPRIRKPGKDIVPRPPADIVPRSPFTGWDAVDGLVWRARHAVESPVFWNRADLDAAEKDRRDSVEAGAAALTASYDLNYYRALPDWGAFPGEDERWQSYRASTGIEVSHEPEPPAHAEPHPSGPLPAGDWTISLPPGASLDAKVEAIMGDYGTGPFYRMESGGDGKFAVALEPRQEKALGAFNAAHDEEDAAENVPGPVEDPPTPGPGTPGEAGK